MKNSLLTFTFLAVLLFINNPYSQVNQEWEAIYNGPGNVVDVAYSIAVDGSGNVYVTGYSWGGSVTRNMPNILTEIPPACSRQALRDGVYYYKLVSGDFSETKKMILIK